MPKRELPDRRGVTPDIERDDPDSPFGVNSTADQDEAFQAKMRKAIARGKERVQEGIDRCASTRSSVPKRYITPGFVPSASSS